MNTYLLTWNPDNWNDWDIDKIINELNHKDFYIVDWNCDASKSIIAGDRLFLVRLGKEPRGIFASGYSASNIYIGDHWSGEPAKKSRKIDFKFDFLLNPARGKILGMEILKSGKLSRQHWSPQKSGISIKAEVAEELENVWFNFYKKASNLKIKTYQAFESDLKLMEGNVRQINSSTYERNPHARKICIDKYGAKCFVCCFDFEKRYGNIGKGFIHVHHLMPISDIRETYQVDPINDLRPVCPNCHSMLHRRNPPLTIEELKEKLKYGS